MSAENFESRIGQLITEAKKTIGGAGVEDHSIGDRQFTRRGKKLAEFIEHTKLVGDDDPMPAREEIAKLCAEAKRHQFFGVCVNRPHIAIAKTELAGSDCKVVTVLSFPNGNIPKETKIAQVKEAAGADEIDMVLAFEAMKRNEYRKVYEDVRAVVMAAGKIPIKVILETGELDEKQIVEACLLCRMAGAAFVKTSTGKGKRGASVEDIRIMRACVGDWLGIKAAGGISEFNFARELIAAGATRIGSSKSVAMIASGGDALV